MLEKMNNKDFDIINQMIVDSFPTHEVREYDKQKALLDNEKFNIYVMRDEKTQQIKAFISIWDIDDFGFVDHFAVSDKFRNEGLGGKILQEIHTILNRRIFLEVDPPETDIAKRRINFYERNGYVLNPFKYELPPLVEGNSPMTLMIMSTDGELSHEKFIELKNSLFKTAYSD